MSSKFETIILSRIPYDATKTMYLSSVLKLGINIPAEICLNIDTENGLTNRV